VDDAEGVGFVDGLARLEQKVGGLGDPHLGLLVEDRGEVAPHEVLHHHEGEDRRGADVVHARDVRALDARAGAGFVEEAIGDARAVDDGREEELQRDQLAERAVAGGVGDPMQPWPRRAVTSYLSWMTSSILMSKRSP